MPYVYSRHARPLGNNLAARQREALGARLRSAEIQGWFDTDEVANAVKLFGEGYSRWPVSRKDVDILFRSWDKAALPPTPFVIRVDTGERVAWGAATGGLAWDNATKVAVGKQILTLGTSTFFRVEEIRGQRLELWVDDSGSLIDAVAVPLSEGQKQQTKRIEEEQQEASPTKQLVGAGVAAIIIFAAISALKG